MTSAVQAPVSSLGKQVYVHVGTNTITLPTMLVKSIPNCVTSKGLSSLHICTCNIVFIGIGRKCCNFRNQTVISSWNKSGENTLAVCTLYDVMVNLQAVDTEVSVETSDDGLLPHTDIVNSFTKGKNRGHLAALLVKKLIDEETRSKI